MVHSLRRPLRLATLLVGVIGLVWALGPSSAQAVTCTSTITTLNYGTFVSPNGTGINSTATLSFSCDTAASKYVRFCISMENSSIPLTSGSNSLPENIYKDSSRTTLFGSFLSSATGGVQIDVEADASRKAYATVTLYGRVPSSHSVSQGIYSVAMAASNLHYATMGHNSGVHSCTSIAAGSADPVQYVPLTAQATVQSACGVSATNMNFPSVSTLSAAQNATSTLSVTCTSGLPYKVLLNGGNANVTDPTQRKMSNGGQQVTYGLYLDSARSQPWGSTVGTNTQSGTGSGSSQSYTVYGRVPAQTTPPPGTYSDTVVITVEY